jgi:sarcosine oxidase
VQDIMNTFDAIVIGLGGMGSAAAFELARRGVRVLGLEQFALGHTQGSSHGHTRIIRKAYYEHPDYVPLVCRAYQAWYALEQRSGKHLLTEAPCLSIGDPSSHIVQGVQASAREHKLPVEKLSIDELRRRWPPFHLPEASVGLLERCSGFLYVDDCVRTFQDEARKLGATLHDNEPVTGWQTSGKSVTVKTSRGEYSAPKLVIAAGPWSARLLEGLGVPLTVLRQVPMWFHTSNDAVFRRDVFPIFIADTQQGAFYSVPAVDPTGLKVALHYGAAEQATPDDIDREVRPSDELPVRNFLRQYLPDANGPRTRASICLYTLTPDRHFVLDRHPEHEAVVLAGEFSGHGFKFAPVVGEVLADLALEGRTEQPIGMFSARRSFG